MLRTLGCRDSVPNLKRIQVSMTTIVRLDSGGFVIPMDCLVSIDHVLAAMLAARFERGSIGLRSTVARA